MSHSVIQLLTANNPVRILGKTGKWVQVEWVSEKDDAIQGWIFGRFLSDNPLTQKELDNLTSANSVAINREAADMARMGPYGSGDDTLLALFLILLIFCSVTILIAWEKKRARRLQAEFDKCRRVVEERIQTCFLVEACPRCHELQHRLLQISPNARSVQLQCTTCDRKCWAAAINPRSYKVLEECRAFWEAAQLREVSEEVEILVDGHKTPPRGKPGFL